MSTQSLADRAVYVLARVNAMSQSIANDDPHRHLIWSMQNAAKAILADALSRANHIAELASDAERLVGELRGKKESRDG